LKAVTNNAVHSVETYFNALRDHDVDAVAGLLHDDVREIIPLAPNGVPDPWFDYRGKDEVLAYVGTIFANFSQVEVVDREVSVTDDGRTVFVEGKGDLIVADGGASYRNLYVFRFSFDGAGLITEIREYANPVPIAPIFGVPLG
jgi:ketosteroid isomerase-like protein